MSSETRPDASSIPVAAGSGDDSIVPASPFPASPLVSCQLDPCDANLQDWDWAFAARASGRLDAYRGQHVVVWQQEVVECDEDAAAAIHRAALKASVSPELFAVLYVDDPHGEGLLHVR
jgi:hypothetical protein